MKLLLHWLRWDLRRFRWPLLLWTALLAGFVCYLGWLHLNLLTVDPRILQYNEAAGAVLGIIEFFLLLRILSTDTAAGTRHFWKSRPPSGFAIAGVKAVIAILFFLALPLLLQWLMYQWCNLGEPEPRWGGKSWPWMLWWTQCLAVGAVLLAASGARGIAQTLAQLAAGAFLLLAAFLCLQQSSRTETQEPWNFVILANRFETGTMNALHVALWLLVSVTLFLVIRRTRTPSPLARALPSLIPPVALLAAVGLADERAPRWPSPKQTELPADTATAIKIGRPFLRGGIKPYTGYTGETAPEYPPAGFSLTLQLSGLPGDCLASTRWRSLRLIHPDGTVVTAAEENLPSWIELPSIASSNTALPVSGFRLRPGSLERFSLSRCRAEGTLSVAVYRWRNQTLPVEPGRQIEIGRSSLVLHEPLDLAATGRGSGVLGSPNLGREMVHLTGIRRGENLPAIHWFLQDRSRPVRRVPLEASGKGSGGYFMEYQREDWMLYPAGRVPPLANAGLLRAVNEGRVEDWHLHASWLEFVGTAQVPVTLDDLLIPRQKNDTRKPEDVLAALRITAEMPPREVKWRVRLALAMPQLSLLEGQHDARREAVLEAISSFLATVPREHLPLLLEIAKDDLPAGNMMMRYDFDEPLSRRIAELLESADVAGLRRSEPRLLRYLRFDLAKRKLIPYSEAHGPAWKDMNDAALQREWEESLTTDRLATTALEHAARHGLPWVLSALGEIADLLPHSHEAGEVVRFMSTISDCPADPKAGIPWLQHNAARLTWDAAAKRWVLPTRP
jgi:hypothetical protein